MPRPGGEADKIGNQYEGIWTVDCALDVFVGKAASITVEAFGEISEGVDFHLAMQDNTLQFHSLKRQKQGGDWSVVDLCKREASTGRSILGDLFNKHLLYNDARLRFVSATGANQLRELSERSQTLTALAEFQLAINGSARLQRAFTERIVPLCDGDEELAFRSLQVLEVTLISQRELTRRVEQRIEQLFYRKDGSQLAPDEFRRMIAEFILEHLGSTLSTEQIRESVDANGFGLRDWKSDRTIRDAVNGINRRYLEITAYRSPKFAVKSKIALSSGYD